MTFEKLYLLVFCIVFFLFVFVLRSYLLYRKTGLNPMVLENADDVRGFVSLIFKTILLLTFVSVFVYVFSETKWYAFLLPAWYLETRMLRIAGWVLLHFSIIWIFVAQLQMKDSWRIGIDEKNKTALITGGLFRFSRNPIFLGVLFSNLGLFLIIPNSATLLVLVLSYFSIGVQIRQEEEFLEKQFGADYTAYRLKVRRWL